MTSSQPISSVRNPFTLVDFLLGRRIAWGRIPDPVGLMELVLQTPHRELLSRSSRGVLYAGLRPGGATPGGVESRGALAEAIRDARIPGVGRRHAGPWSHIVPPSPDEIRAALRVLADPGVTDLSSPPLVFEGNLPQWRDGGAFFNSGVEVDDPIQGGVGDCYFVSALSAVAWTRPYALTARVRQSEGGQQFCSLTFHKVGAGEEAVLVSERLWYKDGQAVYARCKNMDETWAGVYEKAYAKWIGGEIDDRPDYGAIAGGNGIEAIRHLIGGDGSDEPQVDDLSAWDLRAVLHGITGGMGRAVNPAVAGTGAKPDGGDSATEGYASNHAYTILGTLDSDTIVLRNPWGFNAPKPAGAYDGTFTVSEDGPDGSFERKIELNVNGVFAIPVASFRAAFTTIGWVW